MAKEIQWSRSHIYPISENKREQSVRINRKEFAFHEHSILPSTLFPLIAKRSLPCGKLLVMFSDRLPFVAAGQPLPVGGEVIHPAGLCLHLEQDVLAQMFANQLRQTIFVILDC